MGSPAGLDTDSQGHYACLSTCEVVRVSFHAAESRMNLA